MRFIHLSDLHIGKKVNEMSMLEDQKYILKEILQIIDEKKVEGVWVAGDVYDKSIPPLEAVRLWDEFLTELADRELPVFIISGNHDSAERLAFGSHILDSRKIYISPVFEDTVRPITVEDKFGEIDIYLLPFVKPSTVRHVYPEETIESYQDAVDTAIAHMQVDPARRNVLLAHQFVTGSEKCDSEEVSVGGVDNIAADTFDVFDYVALGHLHGPQQAGRETVRYCGTPLKYSFSECIHKKSALIVDMEEKGDIRLCPVPLHPLHDFREIKGTYMEVTAKDFYQDTNTRDYLHVTLTDEEDIPDAIGKLRTIYPNLMRLDYDNKRTREGKEFRLEEQVEKKSPLELLSEFYELQNNQEMTEEQMKMAQQMIEKIWEDR